MGQALLQLTLDFETFYTDKQHGSYSLKTMTTEEYVRDPRFQIIMFSIKKGPAPAQWFSGTEEQMFAYLRALPWHRIMVIGHNMAEFDAFILTEVVGVKPAAFACTLQMARTLHGGRQAKDLGTLCDLYGLPAKGRQVKTYVNKRREDFTPWELQDYGGYCANDGDRCYDLFNIFVRQFPTREIWLADLATKMFAFPKFALDDNLLAQLQADQVANKDRMMERVGDILRVDRCLPKDQRSLTITKLLRKDAVLADVLLNAYDIEPPTKLSPKKTNPDGSPMRVYAFAKTDEGMQELLNYEDESDPAGAEDIQALAAARLSVKSTIGETRVARFRGISQRGLLPVPVVYGKVHTHRLAGGQKINMQNLNGTRKVSDKTPLGTLIRTPRGFERLRDYHLVTGQVMVQDGTIFSNAKQQTCYVAGLRDAIVAPPGKRIVVCDSAQIELRTCHLLAGQMDTIAELRAGVDVYSTFASTLYNRVITKADERERQHGKVSMLQLQYQSGWKSFQKSARTMGGIKLSEDESQTTVGVYRNRFTEIPKLWRAVQQSIPKIASGVGGYIDQWGLCRIEHNKITMPGRHPLMYHNLRQEMLSRNDGTDELSMQYVYDDKESRKRKKLYGGSGTENLCQWLSRHVISDQALEIERKWGDPRKGNGLALVVHDEAVAVVDEDDSEDCLKFMLDCMGQSPSWWPELPVKAEGGIGLRYSECK